MSELGEVTRCWTVTFERKPRHPARKLWEAITRPEGVEGWWGSPARIDLRIGGEWFVDFGNGGSLDGVIVRVEDERRLAFVWGRSVIEWEIEAKGDGCRYTFVHHGQEPGLSPSEEGLAAGWHAFLDSIERLLDGNAFDAALDAAAHAELESRYRERLQSVLG